jgi:hypothetical protein
LPTTTSIFTNVWVNGAYLSRVVDQAACDSTPGSYTLSESSTSTTLYIHPPGSTNPTSDGKLYEVSVRGHGLLAQNRSGTVVYGIHTLKNLSNNGSMWLGTNSRVYNSRASWGGKHNLFVRGGSIVEDTVVDEAYYGSSPVILAVYYEATGPGTDVTFRRVRALSSVGIVGSGIGGHTSSGNFGTILCDSCYAGGLEAATGNTSAGFNFADATAVSLVNCSTAETVGTSVAVNVPTTITGGTFLAKTVGFRVIGATLSASNVTITMGNGTAPSAIRSLEAGSSINIQDSTITVTGAGGWMFQLTGAGMTLTATGNTYVSDGFGWYDFSAQGYSGVTSNNNIFQQTGKQMRYGNVVYSLAEWRTNTGQDLNSTGN